MSEWSTYKIGELGRVVTGKTPPSAQPELFEGDVPFLTPSDMTDDSRDVVTDRFVSTAWDVKGRQLLPSHSICVVCIGATIGKVCMTRRPSHTNQQVNSIVPETERFDPQFVFYTMRTLGSTLRSRAAGAATPILNKTAFSEVTISAPFLETQRRIASILGAYDDLIEVNRRRVTILEQMARMLFEEFAATVEQTALLLDIAAVEYGKNLSKSQLIESGPYPVFGASKVIGRYSSYTHEDRCILLGCRGTVGEFNISKPKSYITNNSFSIVARKTTDFAWLFFSLKKRGVADTVSGSAQPQITLQGVSRVSLLYPAALDRERFHSVVFPLLEMSWSLSEAIEKLAVSRDLLLPRLISGQLSVAAAERELEEAA